MEKPRILILMHYLEIGGAEKALIGFLKALGKFDINIELFLYQHTGELMKSVPEYVKILPEIKEYSILERPLSYCLKKGYFISACHKIKRKYKLKRYLQKNPGNEAVASHIYMDYDIKHLPDLFNFGEYDMAISFLDPPHIMQDKVKSKKKIEWIHTDFESAKYDSELTFERWNKNDVIVSISDKVTESFLSLFPELKPKIVKIENILDSSFIRLQSNMESVRLSGNPVLLSIGRFTYAKNFDNIPQITKLLVNSGLNDLKWYIIGFGSDEILIREKIKETEMEDHVVILGKKINPYPYIKACDFYIQPSRFEGKCVAVREAQILCKPVIISNYPTASSQINHRIDGIISKGDNSSLAMSIIKLYQNKLLQNKIISFLKTHDYGLNDEINKFYNLFN